MKLAVRLTPLLILALTTAFITALNLVKSYLRALTTHMNTYNRVRVGGGNCLIESGWNGKHF